MTITLTPAPALAAWVGEVKRRLANLSKTEI